MSPLIELTTQNMPPVPTTELPGKSIFRVLYGSWAHGTNTPTSDTDWRGVFQLGNDAHLGLHPVKTTVEVKASDEVYWEIGHFCRLLLKGNPNIVGMLFAPGQCIDIVHPAFLPLIDNREKFIHQGTVRAYLGWVTRELHDLMDYVQKDPLDLRPKRLSHVPRLLWELQTMVEDNTIRVKPQDWQRDFIVGVKTGEIDYIEALDMCLKTLDHVTGKVDTSTFREPPERWLNQYLLSTREAYGR